MYRDGWDAEPRAVILTGARSLSPSSRPEQRTASSSVAQWRDPRISPLLVFAHHSGEASTRRHSGAARISVFALAVVCSMPSTQPQPTANCSQKKIAVEPLKNPNKSACQAPRHQKIQLTPAPSTTSLRKIVGILVMLRLIQLIYGSNPSRGSLYRAEINSRRPLEPFFLNRISRTVSIFYPQPPHGPSFWRSPWSRLSGEAP